MLVRIGVKASRLESVAVTSARQGASAQSGPPQPAQSLSITKSMESTVRCSDSHGPLNDSVVPLPAGSRTVAGVPAAIQPVADVHGSFLVAAKVG